MAAGVHTDRAYWAEHALTYHRFMLGVKWFAIHAGALIAFLLVKFAMGASFFEALFVGAVIFLGGVWAMRNGLARSTEVNGDPGPGPEEEIA
jgi:hypothetical protein